MARRRPRRTHLDAGPDLHPMTVIDLFYFILVNNSDLIEEWDRSKHEVWCTCGKEPQVYAHPVSQRPVLLNLPARELRRAQRLECGDPPRRAADPRQMPLDLPEPEIDF